MSELTKEDPKEIFTGERFVPGIQDEQLEIEHYQRYTTISGIAEGKVVVDAACGEGYGTFILAKSAKKVIGIDIDADAIQRASEKYTTSNISFIESNIVNLPLEDDSVDVFVSFETIEHISEDLQVKFLYEISRVLKKDGILIMSTPNKEIYSDLYHYHNEFHIKEFYKDEFIKFLRTKFLNVIVYHQYFESVGVIDSYDDPVNHALYSRNDNYRYDGKYFIGIASNVKLPILNMASVFMNAKKEYEEKNRRIICLQEEEDERNRHIVELDKEITLNRSIISTLQSENEERNNHIKKLDEHIEKASVNCQKIINEKDLQLILKDQEINSLDRIINKKDEEINHLNKNLNDRDYLLNQKDEEINRLNKLLNDRDYIINQKDARIIDLEHRSIRIPKILFRLGKRVLNIPRKIYELLFPLNTGRRVALSKAKNKMLHPIQTIKVRKMYKVGKVPDKMDFLDITFPHYDKPLVSIIIPVYNQINYTYNCLKSILKETKDIAYEIILADDVSTDKTQKIQEFVHEISVVRNETNLGFLRNCNNAAKIAKGKYLMFLNNDTQVLPNWLNPLIELLEKESTIGMVGSKLIFGDGLLQEAGGIIWDDASGWNYGRSQDPAKSEFNYVKDVDYISGAAIMISKSLWDEIGGFDELYVPAYCEDSDLAFEVRKHGYRVVYQPLSQVVHFEGISNGSNINSGIKKYQLENNEKFKEKWKEELTKQYPNGNNVFRARERGRDKKVILVIDHYVPTFDKDAGSKTTFQYLNMFLQKGYSVKFIGDNFYQSEPYTTILQQLGIEVLYGPWYANHIFEWIRENQENIHVVYLNRPHITMKYVDFFKNETHLKLIYYGHDLHSLRLKREYDLTGNPNKLKESKEWLEKELSIMRKADMSYYPSYVEEDEIHKIDSSIPVKAITAYVYDTLKENIFYDFTGREGILFVGGFGHDPNIDAVLWFIHSIYPKIREKLSVTFYIVGSNPPNEIKDIKQEGVIVKGYVTDEELSELYSKCKMVVVPLRYGAGVKGKVIEAAYNGMPIVTTSCGAEGIKHCENLFVIADDDERFANEVVALYNDNKRLEVYSRYTQEFIKEYFSTDAVWNVIEKDFE